MRVTTELAIGPDGGRDAMKVFRITEMGAMQAEEWASQVLLALTRSDINIPPDIAQAGLAGLATMGLRVLGKVKFEEAKPLLAEMLNCVQIVPDPRRPQVVRALIPDDIEEVSTLLKLRAEVAAMHLNFFLPESLSTSLRDGWARVKTSWNTPTSPSP